jgi:hypothetical protein
MRGGNRDMVVIDAMLPQLRDRFGTKLIVADPADHQGPRAEGGGMAGHVSRRAPKAGSVGKHVPQNFTN